MKFIQNLHRKKIIGKALMEEPIGIKPKEVGLERKEKGRNRRMEKNI